MRILFVLCVFICGSVSYSQEVTMEKDGAILWAENCMSCHVPKYFLVAEPDMGHVNELVQAIEFNIYRPESAMNFLYYLKAGDIDEIARFLVYGSHGEKWMSGGLHGKTATSAGTDLCIKCHGNSQFYKKPPVSCSRCH